MPQENSILLGFTVPDSLAKSVFEVDSLPAAQTHNFAWSLARALREGFGGISLVSTVPIQNFPLGKKILLRGGDFSENGFDGVLLGFPNFVGVKQVARFFFCLLKVSRIVVTRKVRWLFLHGVHTPFLLAAVLFRVLGVRAVVVLTDPPGVIRSTDGPLTRLLKRLDAALIKTMLGRLDGVLALAPELLKLVPEKPALVFPGILSSDFSSRVERLSVPAANEKFTIVYAGTLDAAYGVGLLLDAIEDLREIPVCLRVFGQGDVEDRLKALVEIDSRFFYGGFRGGDELTLELMAADLLINPRPSRQSFAVSSFPSKLIEYLGTGRPVLSTRIESIPDAYRPHFLFIDDESASGIKSAILKVAGMADQERRSRGCAAKKFIEETASERSVGRRIFEFVESLK